MRRLFMLLGLLALTVPASSELAMQKVTASSGGSTTVTLNAGEVFIHNDSTSISVWIRVFTPDETVADATTAAPSIEIKFGEGFTFPRTTGVKAVTLITASSTAEVRLIYW